MSDFQKLAQRLITIDRLEEKEVLPSAIFGSALNLPGQLTRRTAYRIGMWPCISETHPELAMGLWTALSYLLEQKPDTRVYRIFAQLADDPEAYQWQTGKSQFDIDDWGIDELDENIALWSKLSNVDDEWQLTVFVENDMAEEENDDEESEIETLVFSKKTLSELCTSLPAIADTLAEKIGYTSSADSLDFGGSVMDEDQLSSLLTQVFHWELNLLLMLWGKEWEDDAFIEAFKTLNSAGQQLNTDFAAWLVSFAVGRAMLPGYSMVGDLLVPRVGEVLDNFSDFRLPVVTLSRALYRLGYTDETYDVLRADLKKHPEYEATRRYLVDTLASSGRVPQALQVLHDALENDWMTDKLYYLYGNILLLAERRQFDIEDYYLIDPNEYPGDELLVEAIAAYEETLKLDSTNLAARHRQLLELMHIDEDRFWDSFEMLLQQDTRGFYLQDVVDAMQMLADVTPAIEMLEEYIQTHSDEMYRMMLASLYLLEEDPANARKHLETLAEATDSTATRLTVEYMMLSVHFEDFEQRFGELNALIGGGQTPSSDSADFLENIIEKAPNFAGAYLLLARAYQRWDDGEAALEVLLDAQKKLQDNPDILEMLGAVLWDSGEKELAFQYLNQGVVNHPDHIPLLVRIARYLFDNGQRADARAYLARAETINPRDRSLVETRAYIARELGNEKNKS